MLMDRSGKAAQREPLSGGMHIWGCFFRLGRLPRATCEHREGKRQKAGELQALEDCADTQAPKGFLRPRRTPSYACNSERYPVTSCTKGTIPGCSGLRIAQWSHSAIAVIGES